MLSAEQNELITRVGPGTSALIVQTRPTIPSSAAQKIEHPGHRCPA
jgi:hypothetical protein